MRKEALGFAACYRRDARRRILQRRREVTSSPPELGGVRGGLKNGQCNNPR